MNYEESPMGTQIDVKAGLIAFRGEDNEAISDMISWRTTKQGHKFWEERYSNGMDDTALAILKEQLIFQGAIKLKITDLLEEL